MSVAVAVRPAGAVLTDDEPSNDTLPAAVQIFPTAVVTTDGGEFTLTFDDIDYLGISSLIVGDIVTVSTTPLDDARFEDPDTFIALFASGGGSALCENDDTSTNNLLGNPTTTGLGSLCRFVIDSAGTWYVGVTGAGNPDFDENGSHFEAGAYQLVVTIDAIARQFPTPTATPAATPTPTTAPTSTPTSTPTPTPTPTATPTPEPGVMLQLVSGGVGLAWLQRRRNRRVRARSRS
jgi:hypothetical protein